MTAAADDLARARAGVLTEHVRPSVRRRAALTEVTDAWLADRFVDATAGGADGDVALVAVGGHGRGELTPGSDLDLLLLHRGGAVADIADRIWYPVWDTGVPLDHSVRTVAEARRVAAGDMKALLGLLDARLVAGDQTLVDELLASARADWRAAASRRMGELRELVAARRARWGDIATTLEPDLKEGYGGLREGSVLRAIQASWLADVPHTAWPDALVTLLDMRDALHTRSGRRNDRLVAQEQADVAAILGLDGADALLREAYHRARVVAHASDVVWHRIDRLTRSSSQRKRLTWRRVGQARVPLADGVVVQDGEVVLALDAHPHEDPLLALRAAAAAAQAGIPLAPSTLTRLARECPPLPRPWPRAARDAFVALLGSGPALVPAWEALDQAGIVERWLPEWSAIRSVPQRNPVHRYTVDRHCVDTAAQAAALARDVDRPDLLLVGALLHDIGKRGGAHLGTSDVTTSADSHDADGHCAAGASIAAVIAARMGFDAADARTVEWLVAEHLLLPGVATRRDIDDPHTVAQVAAVVHAPADLGLLHALVRADAHATGPIAASEWRMALVDALVDRVQRTLDGRPLPRPPELDDDQRVALEQPGVWVLVGARQPGGLVEVTVAADDRIGLLATVAGVLALARLAVRSARIVTVGERAAQIWTVQPLFGDPPTAEELAVDLRRALDGSLDVRAKLRERDRAQRERLHGSAQPLVPPQARVIGSSADDGSAGARATILHVRAHDAPGLLERVTAAIAAADASVAGARVDTLGAEVVDVFFLHDRAGAPLSERQAGVVRALVLDALLSG